MTLGIGVVVLLVGLAWFVLRRGSWIAVFLIFTAGAFLSNGTLGLISKQVTTGVVTGVQSGINGAGGNAVSTAVPPRPAVRKP
jgi:hypothetical protein